MPTENTAQKRLRILGDDEIEALYGDFQRGAFRHGNQQVWIAKKP